MAPQTYSKYLRHLNFFAQWLMDHHRPPHLGSVTVPLLIDVLDDIYAAGYCYSTPNHLRSALALRYRMAVFPQPFPTNHPSFLAALAGYQRLAASRSRHRQPLRQERYRMLVSYAKAWFNGLFLLQLLAALSLGYELLMRISEARAVHPHHVSAGQDGMLVYLERSKTDPLARGISLRITDVFTAQCLQQLLAVTKQGPLITISTDTINEFISSVARAERWKGFYSFHSLRHGKATDIWLRTGNIYAVMLAGRWKSRASARWYLHIISPD